MGRCMVWIYASKEWTKCQWRYGIRPQARCMRQDYKRWYSTIWDTKSHEISAWDTVWEWFLSMKLPLIAFFSVCWKRRSILWLLLIETSQSTQSIQLWPWSQPLCFKIEKEVITMFPEGWGFFPYWWSGGYTHECYYTRSREWCLWKSLLSNCLPVQDN